MNQLVQPVIGISGLAGSGKDYVARVLQQEFRFEPVGFSRELKLETKERFPLTLEEIAKLIGYNYAGGIDHMLLDKPPVIRRLFQEYGTNVRRQDDPDYWVQRWFFHLDQQRPKRIVVPDVRFINEGGTIKSCGGMLVKVKRMSTKTSQQAAGHVSEEEWNSLRFDHEFDNHSSLDDLRSQVVTWVSTVPWGPDLEWL